METTRTETAAVPQHVGIIMDGNGRWAIKRNLSRSAGHKEGLKVTKRIVKTAAVLGIKYLTLYTFSTENWKRTQEEVGYLMNLVKIHLRAEFQFYKDNNIRVTYIGDKSKLPKDVIAELDKAYEDTAAFTGMTVILAINYGGRNELVRSATKIVSQHIPPEQITEQLISSNFDFPTLPDADLIIRTGGEKRLSNFLLWHSAYAELEFSDTLWPDYTEDEFSASIYNFAKRRRRFGGD